MGIGFEFRVEGFGLSCIRVQVSRFRAQCTWGYIMGWIVKGSGSIRVHVP